MARFCDGLLAQKRRLLPRGIQWGLILALGVLSIAVSIAAQEVGVEEEAEHASPPPRTPQDEVRRAKIVARIGDAAITIGQIEDEIAIQAPWMRARYRDRNELIALYENLLRFELLAREAERRGYGNDPEVREATAQAAVQQLIRKEFDEKITLSLISEEEIRAYYESHPEEFSRPELRRVSHILLDREVRAKELLEEAKRADPRAFRQLAAEHSLDAESRYRGGDLRFFDEKGLAPNSSDPPVEPAIVKAAFALREIGEVAGPIRIDDNRWSIVKLTGIRPAEHRSFEQAEEGIRQRLWREKREQAINRFAEELRKRTPVQVYYECLEPIRFDPPERVSQDPPPEAKD